MTEGKRRMMPSFQRKSHRGDGVEDAAMHLARALGFPFVRLEEYSISCGILRKVPAETACRLRCVPMVWNAHRVVLAVEDAFQALYLTLNPEVAGVPRGRRLELAFTTTRGLDAALDRRLRIVRG